MDNEPTKKNIVQDIMPKKRSIRDIELPSRSPKKQVSNPKNQMSDIVSDPFEKKVPIKKPPVFSEEIQEQENFEKEKISDSPRISSYKYDYDEEKKPKKRVIYVLGIIFLLVVAFGVSALFKSAKITVTPKNEKHTLTSSMIFNAKKDVASPSLGFQVITITKDLEKKVVSDGEKEVSKKAQGSIVIYNNYSTASQKLVATTRFQTAEGLIYRLVDPVSVPGKQTKNGKTVPGSIEVKVIADESGQKYNIGLSDFTIPGFKGDPKYSQIYAKSKTNMIGGFVGMQKIISEEVISTTDSQLQKELKEALVKDISLQIPDNFVLFDTTVDYSFGPINSSETSEGEVILQKKAVAKAIIFDKGLLSREIVSKILPESKDDTIKVVNLDKLIFSTKDNQDLDFANLQNVDFSLSGDAQFVWVFDENKLKSELVGLSKKQAKIILSSYKSISEVWVETAPFWNQTIPEDIEKIEISNTLSNY